MKQSIKAILIGLAFIFIFPAVLSAVQVATKNQLFGQITAGIQFLVYFIGYFLTVKLAPSKKALHAFIVLILWHLLVFGIVMLNVLLGRYLSDEPTKEVPNLWPIILNWRTLIHIVMIPSTVYLNDFLDKKNKHNQQVEAIVTTPVD